MSSRVVDDVRLHPGASLDGVDRVRQRLGRDGLGLKDARPPEHRVERRSQLVRDDGQELVLGVTCGLGKGTGISLALQKLVAFGLGLLAIAQVHGAEDARAFGVMERRAADEDRNSCALRIVELLFVGSVVAIRQALIERRRVELDEFFRSERGQVDGARFELLARECEQFEERVVRGDDQAALAPYAHGDHPALENAAKAGLASTNGLFGFLARRNLLFEASQVLFQPPIDGLELALAKVERDVAGGLFSGEPDDPAKIVTRSLVAAEQLLRAGLDHFPAQLRIIGTAHQHHWQGNRAGS